MEPPLLRCAQLPEGSSSGHAWREVVLDEDALELLGPVPPGLDVDTDVVISRG